MGTKHEKAEEKLKAIMIENWPNKVKLNRIVTKYNFVGASKLEYPWLYEDDNCNYGIVPDFAEKWGLKK